MSGSSFDEETRILAAETAAAEAESRLTQSKQEIDSLTVELENVKSDRKDLAAEYVALKHNFNAIHRDFAIGLRAPFLKTIVSFLASFDDFFFFVCAWFPISLFSIRKREN